MQVPAESDTVVLYSVHIMMAFIKLSHRIKMVSKSSSEPSLVKQ